MVFPNPASERLTIQISPLNYLRGQKNAVIEVYNVLGEKVKEIPLPTFAKLQRDKEEIETDVSQLPAGMYYVIVKSGAQMFTKQFVVWR